MSFHLFYLTVHILTLWSSVQYVRFLEFLVPNISTASHLVSIIQSLLAADTDVSLVQCQIMHVYLV